MVTQIQPRNIRPWGYQSPLLTAVDEQLLVRWGEFNRVIGQIALYDPARVPLPLLDGLIETFAGPGLYHPVLGDDYNRGVFRNSVQLNLWRGTRAALDLFSSLVNIGYYYQINRIDLNADPVPYPDPGIPNTITFWVSNRLGEVFTTQELDAIKEGYRVLLPRTLDIEEPIRIAHEGLARVAPVAWSRQLTIWRSDSAGSVPVTPTQGSWGPSFDQEEFN